MFIRSVNAAAPPQATAESSARVSDARPRASAPAVDRAALREAVEAANKAMRAASSTVEFSVAEDTGKTIVRVVDQATHEVIRQIPSEEMIAIAREIDRFQGLLLRSKA